MIRIESTQNKVYKLAKSLNLKKYRDKENKYLLEGLRYVQSNIEMGHTCEALLCTDSFLKQHLEDISKELAPIFVLDEKLFMDLAQTERPQGIIGVFHMQPKRNEKDLLNASWDNQNMVLLDRIQDPGNLGTIIRTADAAGIKTILLAKGTVDLYNPKVVRSTAGSLQNIQVYELLDLKETLISLKEKGIKIMATALERSVDYRQIDYSLNSFCLVIGNEANGVANEIIELADYCVKIPIHGQAESLNAAVAAGIMMYKIQESNIPL